MRKKALVLVPVNDEHKRILESAAPEVDFMYETRATVSEEQILSAEILFGSPPSDIIKTSKNLKWVQLQSAGADAYQKLLPEGIFVTTAVGSYGLAIAECVLGSLLSLSKRFHIYRDDQHKKVWNSVLLAKPVYESTVLIVGMGDSGSELARRLKALGATVLGIKRTMAKKPDYLDELHLLEDLDILLPRADTVVLCLPKTNATNNIIDARRLRLMKKDAILINSGRGNSIVENDLCDVIEEGHLWGAALDVFQSEPLSPQSRLWELENVIITPHSYGGLRLEETLNRMVRIFKNNLAAYINTGKVPNAYDPAKGY